MKSYLTSKHEQMCCIPLLLQVQILPQGQPFWSQNKQYVRFYPLPTYITQKDS